ncbi:tail protein [Vibrio phage D81]
MAREFSLDDRVWAINGDRTDPDTVTTSEANLLNVADGHIDSQGPFSDIMNWEQYRVSHMLNAMEQHGVLEWSAKTKYGTRGLCVDNNGQLMQSRKPNNINHPLSDTSWWIEYVPTGMGDMLASVYDINGNGIVDKASSVDGVTGSGNSTYYGKDSTGNIGFHAIPPDGDMKKSVYDTNDNGRVDNADSVFGVDSAGADKYYGTDTNGTEGFFDLPPKGDMLKSVYDTTDTGRVDIAESIFGIAAAKPLTYYGKDKDGSDGFFEFISQLPETATRWPTAFEIGALDVLGQAADSALLDSKVLSEDATADTVVQRDGSGDISARLFRSNFATQTAAPASSAGICFRTNPSSDNYMRFVTKAGMKSWLGYTKAQLGLGSVQNYPVSHIASGAANSKSKYASEYAVGVAWKLAKQAYDATLVGGKVDSAQTADKLSVSRVIALNGDVVGSVNFDGSQNVNMSTSVADNSHKHVWANITDSPIYTKRWPTAAEVGVRTDAQNDAQFISRANGYSRDEIEFIIRKKFNVTKGNAVYDVKDEDLIGNGGVANRLFAPGSKNAPWSGYGYSVIPAKYNKDNYFQWALPYNDAGHLSFRCQANGIDFGWRRVYHEGHKPTAADVGAYSRTESNTYYAPKTHTHRLAQISDIATQTPEYATSLGSTDLNDLKSPSNAGFYYQSGNANATVARHYPLNAAGSLLVQKAAGITQTYIHYFDGRMWVRSFYNGNWSDWAQMYDTRRKPDAAAVGALPISGGTVKGNMGASNEVRGKLGRFSSDSASSQLVLKRTTASSNVGIRFETNDINNFAYLSMRPDGNLALGKNLNSASNPVLYTAANKPTAADVGAEPTLDALRKRKITVGTGTPSGGSDGDIYLQYK